MTLWPPCEYVCSQENLCPYTMITAHHERMREEINRINNEQRKNLLKRTLLNRNKQDIEELGEICTKSFIYQDVPNSNFFMDECLPTCIYVHHMRA